MSYASLVIRLMLEQEEQQLKALRDSLVAGEQSGKPKAFDNEAFKRKMHRKYVKSDTQSLLV